MMWLLAEEGLEMYIVEIVTRDGEQVYDNEICSARFKSNLPLQDSLKFNLEMASKHIIEYVNGRKEVENAVQ